MHEAEYRLVGHAGNSVTDMSFPPSSEQGRKATRIAYTGSFSNAGLAPMETKGVSELPAWPTYRKCPGVTEMAVAKVTEIIASSSKGFDDAVAQGVKRANKTLKGVKSVWIKDQKAIVENGKITEFRVTMKVSFILKG
ncbi:MAG: dodecin family protein [Granulosicoccus sp.]